ncbi:hypothetical protein [Streptomyces prunicolor]|uniref:hypothetical protein n=1 Tax=Streptomyces prunicolor TaxID=67348 RepID=UPI0034168EAD
MREPGPRGGSAQPPAERACFAPIQYASRARSNHKKFGDEPAGRAIGRARGGSTPKTHLVANGKGRASAFVPTGGQVAGTTMLPYTLDEIRVAGATGRPRQRPDRLPADKCHPSRSNREWLRE